MAQGRPATASSAENASTPASAAFDGNAATRWSSAFSDPQWIQVDRGATATISQVVLQWDPAFATALVSSLSAARTVKLAGATRAVLGHLARLDGEREVVDRLDGPEVLAEARHLDRMCHRWENLA